MIRSASSRVSAMQTSRNSATLTSLSGTPASRAAFL